MAISRDLSRRLRQRARDIKSATGRDAKSKPIMLKRKLQRAFPLCIEAIAVTCGGQLRHQLRPFIEQMVFFNPELPIHIATDEDGYNFCKHLLRDTDKVWIVDQSDIDKFSNKSLSKDRGSRWSKTWIGIKLENFRRAVEHYNCGVMLCDSDFIFLRSFPRISWDADLVLSTHRGPLLKTVTPEHHGYFNAGMALTDDIKIVDKWIEYYDRGMGSFYEQQLLEMISDMFVTDLFPADWNWGGWRNRETIIQSKRRPLIIHTHVSGVHRREKFALADLAQEELEKNERSYGVCGKKGFYHCPKAAGSTLMRTVHNVVIDKMRYQVMDSFKNGRQTDWTREELEKILEGKHKYQRGNRFIVHQHGQNWPEDLVTDSMSKGWEYFALYRPIRDRLCSFYTWSKKIETMNGSNPMGKIFNGLSMEDHLNIILDNPNFRTHWHIPSFSDDMNWYPATTEGILECMKSEFNLILGYEDIVSINKSENAGFEKFIENGDIPKSLEEKINSDPMVIQWDQFIESKKKC